MTPAGPRMTPAGSPSGQYPVNLMVEGRRCLVVGGGEVARRKVEGLLAAGAVVTVVAPEVDERIRRLPGVSVEEREYRQGDVAGYRLVIAATDAPGVNGAVFADGEAAGIWVNGADDPEHCSFTLPAVVRRGPSPSPSPPGGAAPPSPAGCASAWRPRSARSSRSSSTCCPPSATSSRPRAAPPRARVGSWPSTPACSASSKPVT